MFVTLKKDYLGQKAGVTIDIPDEPVAKSLIDQGVAEAIQGDPYGPIMAKAVEASVNSLTKSLDQIVTNTLQEFAKAQAGSNKNKSAKIFGPGGEGDTKKTFGAFLLAVTQKDHKTLEEMGSQFVQWGGQKAAMQGTQGSLGGYTVPTEFYEQIMALGAQQSIVRPRAFVIPQSARETDVPYLDVTTAQSAGDTAYLGGLVARWTEEATAQNESEPSFKQARLINYELSGYSKMSNSLAADSPGLEQFLLQLFGQAVAWYEDYAFLRGTGAGQPLGAQTWTGFVSVTRSAASAFGLPDFAGVLARWLPNYNQKTSCWVCHPTVLPKVYQLASLLGQTLMIENVRDQPKHMLAGLPLEVTEKVPALNTAGDIGLYDFSKYLIGDRKALEVAFSDHVAFTTNQVTWRFVSRVGGMPWLRDKITLADATNTISPFVGLAAG